jgi:hypothetical protein
VALVEMIAERTLQPLKPGTDIKYESQVRRLRMVAAVVVGTFFNGYISILGVKTRPYNMLFIHSIVHYSLLFVIHLLRGCGSGRGC